MSGRSFTILIFLMALILIVSPHDSAAQQAKNDRRELKIFRPETGVWHSRTQSDGGSYSALKLNTSACLPLYADHDGDGETDLSAWDKNSGIWHIRFSSTGEIRSYDLSRSLTRSGIRTESPAPADIDGDGKDDIVLWQPEMGTWTILLSAADFNAKKALVVRFGEFGDIPVTADYDGDGKADLAIFRPSDNTWYIRESSTNNVTMRTFGSAAEDILVPADYNGDGKAEIAVYRRGTWLVLDNETGKPETFRFGFDDSVPVPDDYDGDGATDMAVYQEGTWYVYETKKPRFVSHVFGIAGDIPLASLRGKTSITNLP